MELLSLRTRMKDLTMKMLALDPKKSGVKVMEHFWRKSFHEPWSVVRQLRGSELTKHQTALIQSHLLSGIGTYHHLILHLSEKYGWTSDFLLDFTFSNGYGWSAMPETKKSLDSFSDETMDQSWVESNVVKCLVWLGDLARYLETDVTSVAPVSSTRYYQLATVLAPHIGQPFNNLAMLAGDRNHGLDQLFLYLKCVCCKSASENGLVNLKRMLDKQFEFGSDSKNLVGGLLQLVRMVFNGDSQEKVTEGCQHSLAYLHTCLEQTMLEDVADYWLRMTISVVILLVQHKKEPVCQAWMLAIFSHLAGKLVSKVLDKFPELELKEPEEDIIVEEHTEEENSKDEGIKRRRNKLENMLRRRRAQSGSEGDDSEESSDEVVDSEDDYEDEEDEDENSDEFLVESSSEDDSDDDVVIEQKPVATQKEVVNLSNHGELLSAIMLCQTWLRQHPHLLAQTGQGSEQFWKNLANLVTVLCLTPRDNLTSSPDVTHHLDSIKAETKMLPLPEDWLIRGHDTEADDKLDWFKNVKDDEKDNVNRLVRLAEFRDWLCGHADSKITWDQERNMARFRKMVEETDKKNVMKHMAELWLRQEVKELEKETIKEGGIVVVDSSALVSNLHMVKRTLGLKKFTVIIPTIAVQQLDGLKKTERGAREAIRWLERELSRGNKWLKAQKSGESSVVEGQTGNVSKHQLQLLQCLAYQVSRFGAEMVTLLTGDKDIISGDIEFLGNIRDEIRVENVEGFVPRVLGVPDKIGKRARRRPGRNRHRDMENIG